MFKWILCFITIRPFSHSRYITVFVTRATRRVPLVEKELLTLPEHPSSYPGLSGIRVAQSLDFCVAFCS